MAQFYDVIVVGTQISGLVAAALLAKRGRRVLLVDHGQSATTYPFHGMRLPLLPNLFPSLEQAPHVQRVHDELGLTPTLRQRLQPLPTPFQVVLPKRRINMQQPFNVLLKELGSEYPEYAEQMRGFIAQLFAFDDALTAFLRQMPALTGGSLWENLKTRRMLAKMRVFSDKLNAHPLLTELAPTHPIRNLLQGPLVFFSNLWTDAPSFFQGVRLFSAYLRGMSTMTEGLGSLQQMLIDVAVRNGVTLRQGAMVANIRTRRRHLLELEIEDERYTQTADYFISNTQTPFYELLKASQRHTRFVSETEAVQPTGGFLTLNLVVEKAVIPQGMGHALFLSNGRLRARQEEESSDPPLLIQRMPIAVVSNDMPTKFVEDKEVLHVRCPVRVQDIVRSPARLEKLKTSMMARVRRVVPFLDAYLHSVSLPTDAASWDVKVAEQAPLHHVDPWLVHPLFEVGKSGVLGITARNQRTYYRNLVHCGRDVVPGLGLEGEYIAGLGAVSHLERMAGRKWRL